MAVVDVLNKDGEKVSQVDLPDSVFDVPVKKSVLHEIVTMQLSNRRSGTASVKHRSDVKGSGRKLFRQKGTGRARRGDIKAPLLRGGGVVFGPDSRSYERKIPKKKKRLAIKMALSDKLNDNKIAVLNRFELDRIKTGVLAKILTGLNKEHALIITDGEDRNLELSSRNIPNVKVMRIEGLNVYDILKYRKLMLVQSSLEQLETRLMV